MSQDRRCEPSISTDDQNLLTRHLRAAEGYVELGMFLDANAELDEIAPDLRAAPEVLAVRLGIYSGLKKWERED